MDTHLTGEVGFAKRDDERRVVYGWASIIKVAGEPVVDHQGDLIEEADLIDAAHDFVSKARRGGVMHIQRDNGDTVEIGEVVESVLFTEDMQKSLGMDLGKTGWFIGLKVSSDEVWKMVKDGDLQAFSVGGSGMREPI